jgi:hypothetical protein
VVPKIQSQSDIPLSFVHTLGNNPSPSSALPEVPQGSTLETFFYLLMIKHNETKSVEDYKSLQAETDLVISGVVKTIWNQTIRKLK